MGRLDGKVALISGVARGQGRSHAVRLAREGAQIIGFDICQNMDSVAYPLASEADLKDTVRLVEEQDQRIIARKLDVRDPAGVGALVEEAVAEFGRLDIVCANAGIMPFSIGGDESHAFQDAVDVLLVGVYNTVSPAIPHIIAGQRGGSIILTSSANGLRGIPDTAPGTLGYGAAKTGVVGLMRHWALALGPHNIRVNTVHPTGVNTGMVVNEQFGEWVQAHQEVASFMHNLLPVELIEPDDVSNAIAFLCSDEAKYVTGQTLAVDAGSTV